ncbi:MAG: hypothetical protein M3332_02585, partial [Actinomycetota bacterium]|nr:hypothetical protein [Actinomycetota bacterium]
MGERPGDLSVAAGDAARAANRRIDLRGEEMIRSSSTIVIRREGSPTGAHVACAVSCRQDRWRCPYLP